LILRLIKFWSPRHVFTSKIPCINTKNVEDWNWRISIHFIYIL